MPVLFVPHLLSADGVVARTVLVPQAFSANLKIVYRNDVVSVFFNRSKQRRSMYACIYVHMYVLDSCQLNDDAPDVETTDLYKAEEFLRF